MSRRLVLVAPWLLLLGLSGWLTAGALRSEVGFNADAERDLFEVYAWSHFGRLPERGVLHASLGLDLGPAYFAVLAPVNALWTSPLAVHAVNSAVFVLGLGLFAAGLAAVTSRGAALTAAGLYALSEGHVALMTTAHHVGAISGAAVGFLGALGLFIASGRRRWLWLGAALLAGLMQLHVLAWSYAATALLVLVLSWRRVSGRAVAGAVGMWLLATLPLWVYLVPGLGRQDVATAGHAGGAGFDPVRALVGTLELAEPHWLLGRLPTGLAVIALAGLGLVVGRGLMAAALRLQLALGLVAVAIVVSFESSGRYWLAAMPALFAVAAFGLHALERRWRHAPWAMLLTLAASALVLPPPAWLSPRPPDGASLSLLEQEAVVDRLVTTHGLFGGTFVTRVHGALLGPFSGVRYLERAARDGHASTALDGDWVVEPGPAPGSADDPRALTTETLSPAGRPIRLTRVRPVIDKGGITAAGRPCGHVLPFMWSQQSTALLKLVGFPGGHGPDVHRCLAWGAGLSLPISAEGARVTIEFTDDSLFRGVASDLALHVTSDPALHVTSDPALRGASDPALSAGGTELDVQTVVTEDRVRRIVHLPPGAPGRRLVLKPTAARVVFLDVY